MQVLLEHVPQLQVRPVPQSELLEHWHFEPEQELVEQPDLELQVSATQTPLVPRLQVWDEPQEVSSLVQLEASHTAGVAVQELLEHWVRLVQPHFPLEQTPLAQFLFLASQFFFLFF